MITPFIGISVMVHLFIIFIYKLFNITQKKVTASTITNSKSHKAYIGIVVAIFSMVIVPAGLFIHLISIDQHSSARFVIHAISGINKTQFVAQNNSAPQIISNPIDLSDISVVSVFRPIDNAR